MDSQTFTTRTIFWQKRAYKQAFHANEVGKPYFEIAPVCAVNELYPEMEKEWHVHDFYSIQWFHAGGGKHGVDFNSYPIEDGMMFFVAPEQFHCLRNMEGQEGVAIAFSKDFILPNDNFYPFLRFEFFNRYNKEPFCRIPKEHKSVFDELVNVMMKEHTMHQDSYAHYECQKLLLALFLFQTRRYGVWNDATEPDIKNPGYMLYMSFLNELENNMRSAHKVGQYAAMLNVSEKSLALCIKKYANTTPKAFISERLALEAKRILRYTQTSVKETAMRLGFEDESNFTKFFKHQVGMLPQDFRSVE